VTDGDGDAPPWPAVGATQTTMATRAPTTA